jgi:hypothetical protein
MQLTDASVTVGTHSEPSQFADNIIWQNRQFFFFVDDTSGCTPGDTGCLSTYGVCPDLTGALACPGGNTVVYDDLAPVGLGPACSSCILTGADPLFVSWYVNGDRSSVFQPEITSGIQTPAAFDEGGNFIRLKYGPLALYDDATPNDGNPGTLFGDYHIQGGSLAVDAGFDLTGTYPELLLDFDLEARPAATNGLVDIGADEVQPTALLAPGPPAIEPGPAIGPGPIGITSEPPAIDSGPGTIRSAPPATTGGVTKSPRGKTDQ